MISMPTGSRKTRVVVQAVVEAMSDDGFGDGVLWVADRSELCEQAVEAWIKLIVFDEAHRSIAPTFTSVMNEIGLTRRQESNEPFLLGLTATPYRGYNEEETKWLVNRYHNNRLDTGAFDTMMLNMLSNNCRISMCSLKRITKPLKVKRSRSRFFLEYYPHDEDQRQKLDEWHEMGDTVHDSIDRPTVVWNRRPKKEVKTMNDKSKSVERGKKTIKIVVNGRSREVTTNEISFDELVDLAFHDPPRGPQIVFTITFRNGESRIAEGVLDEGQTVKVQNRTIIKVTRTDPS